MARASSMRRSIFALIPALFVAILGGCGDNGGVKPSELPDQGKAVLPQGPGQMKKEKGMDRFGS